MNTVVCVKETQGELSPFDQSAVECALEISDRVTVVSMGRPSAKELLQRLTRLGCEAVLLTDTAFAGADTLATAYALSLAVDRLKPDLIICGRQSIDGDTAQTGPALATMLGLNSAANVMQFERQGDSLNVVTREGDVTLTLPALITVERIRQLRFPKLRSKTGEVTVWTADDIRADKSKCGLLGSPTKVIKTFESQVGQRKCTFIDPSELKNTVATALKKSRDRVTAVKSETLLPLVWCVGDEVVSAAQTVAERVRVIPRDTAENIAALIKSEEPDVVLWSADLWGRFVAPQVQAMLNTGLCADCTALETDGKELFMYRPAFGGTLTAKIRCTAKPTMATVRLSSNEGADILVGCGKGVAELLPQIKRYADSIGAELAASRGLVDSGVVPYSMQVGLTGRTIASAVYIATGISGAVHHTCALDRVGTVIAVNPDKNARIFEYADYGIVADAAEVFKE